jgi:peptidoglycan/LPS O-acetylase OafA/YrhL
MPSKGHRIPYIDGLRAVAVLVVVACHALPRYITIGQSFGVDLFFVISGFCLSYPSLAKLYERGSATFDVYRYAGHRIVRIVPPYYIAIAVFLVAAAFLGPIYNPSSGLDPVFEGVSPLNIARQALFLDSGTTFLSPSFWSLAVEFRWYLLFPIALWLWTKSPRAFITVAIAIAIAASGTKAYSTDLFVLPAFLLGIVAADIRIRGHRFALFAAPACVLAFLLAYLKTGPLMSPLWEVAVFLLVVAAGATPWLGRMLSMKIITVIGVTSYSIYLMQQPVIEMLQREHVAAWAGIVAAVAAGFAFWFVAERPFTETAVRTRLVSAFEQVFAKWFPRIDIGREISLSAPQGDARLGYVSLSPLREGRHDVNRRVSQAEDLPLHRERRA